MLDGNARRDLATVCQTWAEPELVALMALPVHKNMIGKVEYPQAAEIEARCVHMLAGLWNAPDALSAAGASVIGSSAACMLAGLAAKWRWRAKQRAEGKQVIAQYYNYLRLGDEGHRSIHEASYDTGQYLAAEIVELGPFELLCDSDPATGLPTVTWRIREGEDPGYTLFDLADRLRARGWHVPAYTLTGTASDIAVQRTLVRLGVSRDMVSLLLNDFRDALAHFSRHPVTVPVTKDSPVGLTHL